MTNAKPLRSRLAAAAFLSASLLAPASVALAKPRRRPLADRA